MAVELSTLMLKVDGASAQKSLKDFANAANATGVEGTRMGKAYEEAAKNLVDAAGRVEAKYKSQTDVLRGAAKEQLDQLKAMQAAEKQGDKNIAKLQQQEKSQQAIIDALQKSTASIDDVEKAESKLTATKDRLAQAMTDQKVAQDATREAGEKYAASRDALAKAEGELAGEMQTTVELFNQGRQVIADSQTPLEAYNQRIAELERLAREGAIGQAELASETERAKAAMESAEGTADSLANTSKKLFVALGVGVAAFKAFQFAVQGAAKAQTNMMATSKLEGVLRATGGAAGVTSAQLSEMGQELLRTTAHASTAITEAQTLLLTFREIGEDVFPRTMSVVSDMASVFGSLDNAAMQVGKALSSPTEGLTALSRVGVRFTEEQKSLIETMVATGNTAGAQALILAELESRFGGVSKAIADTPAGKLQALRNEYSDLQAEIGAKLLPTLVLFQQALNAIAKFMSENLDIAVGIAVAAIPLLIPPLVAATAAIAAKTAAIWAMTAAMLANPLFAGAALLVAGITAVVVAVKRFREVSGDTAEAVDNNAEAIARQREQVTQFFNTVEQRIKSADAVLKAHRELMMSEADAGLTKVGEKYDALIDSIEKRLAAFDAGIEIPVVMTMEGYDGYVSERDTLEKRLTELVTARSRERAKVVGDAGKAERDARANILEQMRLDLMDANTREFAILEKAYTDRQKMFAAGTEGRVVLDRWYAAQKSEIEKKIADEEKAKAEERAVFTDRLLTDRQRVEAAHTKSVDAIIAAEEKYGIAAEQVAALKVLADREMEDSLRSLASAQEKAHNELLGIEQNARAKIIAGYEERLQALQTALNREEVTREEAADAAFRIEAQKVKALAEFDAEEQAKVENARARLLDQLYTEEQMISASYQRRVAAAQSARAADLISEREYQALRVKYQQDADRMRLAAAATHYKAQAGLFGGMTDLMGAMFGEEFALTKAFAIAAATVNVAAAIASAAAAQPFIPAGLAAIGSAMSATAGLITTIKSASFAGKRDRGGTLLPDEIALVAERRPEFINGGLLTEPTLVRGPANITSGAETERILAANRDRADAVTRETLQETTNVTQNFYDARGNFVEDMRAAVRSGDLVPVIREALQAAGRE